MEDRTDFLRRLLREIDYSKSIKLLYFSGVPPRIISLWLNISVQKVLEELGLKYPFSLTVLLNEIEELYYKGYSIKDISKKTGATPELIRIIKWIYQLDNKFMERIPDEVIKEAYFYYKWHAKDKQVAQLIDIDYKIAKRMRKIMGFRWRWLTGLNCGTLAHWISINNGFIDENHELYKKIVKAIEKLGLTCKDYFSFIRINKHSIVKKECWNKGIFFLKDPQSIKNMSKYIVEKCLNHTMVITGSKARYIISETTYDNVEKIETIMSLLLKKTQ